MKEFIGRVGTPCRPPEDDSADRTECGPYQVTF